jgi:uncharacterized protein YbbK (DUF523 family)/uncharacterized protein YbgA (DUF1722 family)
MLHPGEPVHLDFKSRLRLGVSSCLTGDAVRYDGSHKRDHWLMDRMTAFSDLYAVCPEAILGVPRETLSLIRDPDGAVGVRGDVTGIDFSARLDESIRTDLDEIDLDRLDGWVFKSDSPSCATRPIEVTGNGVPDGRERGRFAAAVLERCSWLPVIDEEGLTDPTLRRHFLERAFARAAWREFIDSLPTKNAARDTAVADWLGRYDLLLLAREQHPVAGGTGTCDPAALRSHGHLLFASLDSAPTRCGQVAAFREAGDHLEVLGDETVALAVLIREYENGHIDVEVPRQLLRGLCARGGDRWLRGQHFLDPFPVAWRDGHAPSLPFTPTAQRSPEV